MILVALGANLPSQFGSPPQTLYAALLEMGKRGLWPAQVSRIWRTAPVPYDPDTPWYYNAVAEVQTSLSLVETHRILMEIELEFGRIRTMRNAPRLLDLDLIAYHDERVNDAPDLVVPHPRMQERSFVLLPLQDIAEDWVHPVSGQNLKDLIAALENPTEALPVEGGWDEAA